MQRSLPLSRARKLLGFALTLCWVVLSSLQAQGQETVIQTAAQQTQQAEQAEQASATLAGAEVDDTELTQADRLFRAEAIFTDSPPVIDGVLDDVVWRRAQVITNFIQSTPDEGQPATERTEVRILFDEGMIYIAAFCYDRNPELIVANVLRRDQPNDNSDSFVVTLDTFHDHRNGFYFETNPMGARLDAQITGEMGTSLLARRGGEGFNRDWDVIWQAAAEINDEGWTVEIAIPFWSLRYRPEHSEVWGINFRRTVRRRSEESYWAPIPRQYNATRVSLSGMLTGLQSIGRSRNIQLLPFVTGSALQVPALEATPLADEPGPYDSSFDGAVGLDAKWGITPNMTLDMTVNTDFAQVEADDQQINLTRFSLFFPEKREFFLENAGLFEFGTGSGLSRGGSVSMVGFHSRRIGISEEFGLVPLYGGGRLTGKIGGWSLGTLVMQSKATDNLPSENYSVVRVIRDLAERSRVGMLFTNRQSGSDTYNRSLGFDGRWAVNEQTTVDAWWMKTDTPDVEGTDWSGQARFDWGTPLWQATGSALQIGDAYRPELGFVNRFGVRQYSGSAHWTPYPDAAWVRNLAPHASLIFTTDLENRLESHFLHFDYDMFLPRGDKLSIAYNNIYERLDFPFEIVPGVIIPTGEYTWGEVNLEAQSDASRPVAASLNYTWGDFWSGTRRNLKLEGSLRIGARFDLALAWDRNNVDLPQGAFTTDLVITRFGLDLNTLLSLRGLVQYNSQLDQFLSNIRLRYIYKPGSDLYVVYNEDRVAENINLIDRAVIVKLTYFLRF